MEGLGSSKDRKGKGREADAEKKRKDDGEEDDLDQEYRYWAFMESHPAHTTLPAKAKNEAVQVLTWAWTDGLLPNPYATPGAGVGAGAGAGKGAVPAPFSQEECQELMALLKGFNGE